MVTHIPPLICVSEEVKQQEVTGRVSHQSLVGLSLSFGSSAGCQLSLSQLLLQPRSLTLLYGYSMFHAVHLHRRRTTGEIEARTGEIAGAVSAVCYLLLQLL